MGSFRDQDFQARFAGMGDKAEREFERVMREDRRLGFVRTGLERPPIQVHRLPKHVRYLPDYLTSRCWVEVQGFGQDQIVKVKLDKLEALAWWNQEHPVELFLYDSHNHRWGQYPLALVQALTAHAEIRQFHEGKHYYAIEAGGFFDGDTT